MKNAFKSLLLVVTMLMAGTVAFAQMTTASLGGRIVDTKGETIIGAAVVATHTPSGTTYGAVTNGEGLYAIQGMRTGGPYVVEVSCLGYQTVKFTDIKLALGETYVLDGYLNDDIEALNEAVVVATPASRFAATKTGASTNVSNDEMMNLPNSDRSISALTKLSPYASGMSFAGSDGRSTNFTVDGANLNNNFGLSSNLPGGGTPISLDAIEEIQLVVAPYDVRQTNFVGGGINAVTKSGTNTFKGTAYTYYHDQNLRGNKLMGNDLGKRDKEINNIYGFTLGGPIIKNKLFFFVNFEMQRLAEETIQYRADASKEAILQAVKDKLVKEYNYDPGSFNEYPGGTNNSKLLARLDWNISQAHKLSVRYNNTKNLQWYAPNGNSCDDNYRNKSYNRASKVSQPFSNNMYNQNNNVWSIAGELNSRFSNNFSNRLLATYTSIDDIRGTNSSYFPHIDIMTDGDYSSGNFIPYTSLGTELFTYNNRVQNFILNVQDNLTWYIGAHTITAGLSFENQKATNSYMRSGTGTYRFASVQDFLDGKLPLSFAYTYGANGENSPKGVIDYNQYAAYVQDEWKIADNFKLSYGIRADMMDFNDKVLTTNNTIKAVNLGGKSVDTGLWPVTRVQVSPRIGFNWDVYGDKSMVIRGGTGFFQGRLPLVFFTNMPQNAGMIQVTDKYSSGFSKNDDGEITGVSYSDAVKAALIALNGGKTEGGHLATTKEEYYKALGINDTVTSDNGLLAANGDINGVDRNFRMPQIWKSSLALDLVLPTSFPFTLSTEGMFNKTIYGVKLTDWNIDESKLQHVTNGPDRRVLYPKSGYKYTTHNTYILSNSRTGWGYTVNVTAKAEPLRNLKLMFAYTHTESKEISGMPGSAASSAYQGLASVDGPNFLPLQRSRYVIPDKVMADVSYYLDVLGGFQFDLYYSGYSANGNSFTYSNDMNGDGIAYDLMYIPATKDELRFTSDAEKDAFWAFLEQDKYLSTHKGQYAEADAARSPFIHRFDLRLAKDFKFRVGNTSHKIQLSASIDNIGNLINSSWGVHRLAFDQTSANLDMSGGGYISPLKFAKFDADGTPVFSMNIPKGSTTYPTTTYPNYLENTGECWQILFGLKYFFN